ncbi:glucose 1-dehydrogenase [Neobacillus niacini]|uniref:glucose 1-dehydrogenase n=1 Tax=Neobacillus niacini TaxID=86668 RepID=UPI002FFE5E4C
MPKLMEGKAGIVTGAGSGIGRASAMSFANEGAKVMVSDILLESGEETVRLIKETGGDACFIQCDVSNEDSVKELVDQTIEKYGKLDFAHNNAGISNPPADIVNLKSIDWERTLKVNLDGLYYALKYEIQAMLKFGGGAIVNTASHSGLKGTPRKGAYVATKWGVNGITKTVALEYARQGIRVNSICPSMTLTPMLERYFEQAPDQAEIIKNSFPLKRVGTIEEQANAAVWLCSDKASYITGVNLAVDGGLSSQSYPS